MIEELALGRPERLRQLADRELAAVQRLAQRAAQGLGALRRLGLIAGHARMYAQGAQHTQMTAVGSRTCSQVAAAKRRETC